MNEKNIRILQVKQSEESMVIRLESELESYFDKLRKLQEYINRLNKAFKALKFNYNQLCSRAFCHEVEITKKRYTLQDLRAHIVSKPDKIPEALRNLKKDINKVYQEKQSIDKKIYEILAQLKGLVEIEKKIKSCNNRIKRLENYCNG
jgi:predicted  nucleic acid-binding Zn-ribbon protein